MFDQASGRTVNPWTISVSVVLQTGVILAGILIPLLRVEALPPVRLGERKLAPPHVRLVEIPKALRQSIHTMSSTLTQPVAPRPFVAPTRIPQSVATMLDSDALITELTSVANGDFAAIPGSGIAPPIVTPPAPPSPVVEPAKPKLVVAEPPQVYRVGGNVKAPVLRSSPFPPYPPLARAARVQGTVRLTGVIGKDGTVRSLELTSGHPLLVQAALNAVRTWLYEPGRLNGEPVDVVIVIDVNFRLAH